MQRFLNIARGRVHNSVPMEDREAHKDTTETIVDPVCGMPLDSDAARFHIKHGKQEFHFCSVHCQQEFLADQSGFLKAAPKALNAPCARIEGRNYVCTLNPEFVCDAPGSYPKCHSGPEKLQREASLGWQRLAPYR